MKAKTINKESEIEVKPVQDEKEQSAEMDLLSSAEEKPDESLVEEAYSKLAEIFNTLYQNALFEAGKYIITKFFDDDIELARKKKPIKELSYTKLIERIQERERNSSKRSWLFNSVNLVIQEHDFASVQALGQLNSTQKQLLLPVHNLSLKEKLAEEAVKNNYTTRQLADRIKESSIQKNPVQRLTSLLKNPQVLIKKYTAEIFQNEMQELKGADKKKIQDTAQHQLEKIDAQIKELGEIRAKYIELVKIE